MAAAYALGASYPEELMEEYVLLVAYTNLLDADHFPSS
jgi:hypothetical protein